jgi:hypothetical protein
MRKYYQGIFKPKNPKKYIGNVNNIVYRSFWELKFMRWCDSDSNILEYGSEEIIIPYFDTTTEKVRRYFPDFYMKIRTSENVVEKYIIEIKPKKQTAPPKQPKRKTKNWLYESVTYEKNVCKWAAAEKFCEKNGFKFKIITEKELDIKY